VIRDNLQNEPSTRRKKPGTYDRAAVHFFYGLGDCNAFDNGRAPLTDDFAVEYASELGDALSVESLSDDALNAVARYLRAGDADAQLVAWSVLTDRARSPVTANVAAADALMQRVLRRLYLDPVEARGFIVADPPNDSPVAVVIAADVGRILENADDARSFDTRRVAVDVLKKMQATLAYDTLLAARRALLAARPRLRGDAAEENDDLVARIDRATHPYFE
jgi:hypothetical protein